MPPIFEPKAFIVDFWTGFYAEDGLYKLFLEFWRSPTLFTAPREDPLTFFVGLGFKTNY